MVLAAARIRAEAEANPYASPYDFRRAETLENQLEVELPGHRREIIAGGELNPALIAKDRPDYVDTLTRPNRVTAAASRERLELLNDSGALDAGGILPRPSAPPIRSRKCSLIRWRLRTVLR